MSMKFLNSRRSNDSENQLIACANVQIAKINSGDPRRFFTGDPGTCPILEGVGVLPFAPWRLAATDELSLGQLPKPDQ